MNTKRLIYIIYLINTSLSLLALQKPVQALQIQQTIATPKNSTLLPSQKSQTTFLSQGNAALMLTGLGVLGIGGYLFLKYGPSLFKAQKPPSRKPSAAAPSAPAPLVAAQQPQSAAHETVQATTILPNEIETKHVAAAHEVKESHAHEEEKKSKAGAQEESVIIEMTPRARIEAYVAQEYKGETPPTQEQIAKRTKEILDFYESGRIVLGNILTEPETPTLTKENVHDLIWFLYIYGGALNKPLRKFFEEGTFVMMGSTDAIEKLNKALIRLKETTRASTHFKEYVKPYGERGFDVDTIPTMHTILFAQLDKNKLFIKPESHGVDTWTDIFWHGVSLFNSLARKGLAKIPREVAKQFVDIRLDNDPAWAKERVDQDILKRVTHFIQQAATLLEQANLEQANLTQDTTEIAVWGLQKEIPTLLKYAEKLHTIPQESPAHDTAQKLQKEMLAYSASLQQEAPDWAIRKGHEIILHLPDLLQAPTLTA